MQRLLWSRTILAALLMCAVLPAAATAAATTPTRYSIANGCYTLAGPDGRAVPSSDRLRMQATALGRYLLYRPEHTFVAAQDSGPVQPATGPSPAADWEVKDAGADAFTLSPASAQDRVLTADGTLADPAAAGAASHLHVVPASDCAVYPEAELNASGTPSKGETSYGKVGGLVEGHMHWMTYEFLGGRFHCGKPWDAYGIQYALPDCASIEGPQGTAAPFQNFLNYGNPGQPHDTRGYPTLAAWAPGNLTYEGTYWKWIQRSWMAGLRLMVMGINENRVLCNLQANRRTDCNEMNTVRRGLQDIRDLQSYVDAQAGGPGKGFFQIVTDPYKAREVINQGRMAVVLEIEISEPFDCAGWDTSTCDQPQVDREFDEMYGQGVRSMLLLNKFDNPLTGVRFDSGPVGALINSANKQSSGSYWSARTCQGPLADNTIFQPEPTTAQGLSALLTTAGLPGGSAPAYPPAPHCNTRGLTTLGAHVVERMMDRHMIVNPDHMSQAGVASTLSLLEARRYSGVISPHGWMDPGNWPRIWKLGGMAFPGHSAADDYVKQWQQYRPQQTPYAFGWGYGADLGGLSHQPVPGSDDKLTYPFKSIDDKVTFDREKTGERTFDYTKDGVATYGQYADWFADLRRIGGKQLADDLWNGAESYLDMWERADGIPTPGCHEAIGPLTSKGRGPLRLGVGWQTLLRTLGQPQQRTRAWSWCVRGRKNLHAADVAELTPGGRVELIGTTARGRSLGGIRVGTPTSRMTRRLKYAGGGVRYRRTAKGTYVYAGRGRQIRGVAIASRSLGRHPKLLRRAVARMMFARATQVAPQFVPSATQAAAGGRLTGRPLAGTSDPKLNAALTFLCSLQLH